MSSIRDGSPFADGLVLHLDKQGQGFRARVWHDGRGLAEVSAPTPGTAIAGLALALRDLGLDSVGHQIEAEVTRELVRMVFGRKDFDA